MVEVICLVWCGLYMIYLNLCVGCVLVNNGQIVGWGWYQIVGQGYVEVNVIVDVVVWGFDIKGVMVYVFFEFCSY